MSEWDGTAWAGTAVTARRDTPTTPHPMIGFPVDGGLVPSGVTPTTVLGLSAVARSLDILSNGVSQCEWREMRGNLELPPSRIIRRPQAGRTRRVWASLVTSTLALYDVCYLLKVGGTDQEGVPIGLAWVDPRQVMPSVDNDPLTLLSLTPPAEYFIGQTRVSRDELVILHRSPQPGISDVFAGVLNLARVTFAAALAAEAYASRYWQGGGSPNIVLEADGMVPDPDKISDKWAERRRRGPDYAPVLTHGLKAHEFGADPTTASAVEARRELVADIGRYFGIGSALLNSPNQSSETYSTTEAEGVHLVRYTLKNYTGAIEDAISDQLPGGRRLSIDTSGLTQGSQLARAQAWQLALGSEQPWMTSDEVREAEGLPPREIAPAPAAAPVAGARTDG